MPRPKLTEEEKQESDNHRREYRREYQQRKRQEQYQKMNMESTDYASDSASASSAHSANSTNVLRAPKYTALHYPTSPRKTESNNNNDWNVVPSTPDINLYKVRVAATQKMCDQQAARLLQLHQHSDTAIKANKEHTTQQLNELHAKEKQYLNEIFGTPTPPQPELFGTATTTTRQATTPKTTRQATTPTTTRQATTSSQKRKASSSQGKMKNKVKVLRSSASKVIPKVKTLEFAFKSPGAYTHSNMLLMDHRLPEEWCFDHVMPTICNLDRRLKHQDVTDGNPPKERKYRIVGHRNKENVAPTDIGIKAAHNDHTGANIPFFSVHVLEVGEIDRVADTSETKFHKSYRIEAISEERGTKFSWKSVGFADIDVKILKSRLISQRSAGNMSDEDKAFEKSAHVFLPPRFCINKANPFQSFQLEFEESELQEASEEEKQIAQANGKEMQRIKGQNAVFITDDIFASARGAFLRAMIRQRLADQPNFCDGEVDDGARLRLQKKTVWNEVLLETVEEKWMESMIQMVDFLLDEESIQDDLEIVTLSKEDIRTRFEEAARCALLDYYPRMREEMDLYESMQEVVEGASHYKIYPNNEVLHYSFLHRPNYNLSDMLGKAQDVFPKANKPDKKPPVLVDCTRKPPPAGANDTES